MEKFLATDAEHAIILEDDAILEKSFASRVDELLN